MVKNLTALLENLATKMELLMALLLMELLRLVEQTNLEKNKNSVTIIFCLNDNLPNNPGAGAAFANARTAKVKIKIFVNIFSFLSTVCEKATEITIAIHRWLGL